MVGRDALSKRRSHEVQMTERRANSPKHKLTAWNDDFLFSCDKKMEQPEVIHLI